MTLQDISISIFPCIKDKCILLPICKNKQEIKCDILFNMLQNKHADLLDQPYNIHHMHTELFNNLLQKINTFLPRAIHIINSYERFYHINYGTAK